MEKTLNIEDYLRQGFKQKVHLMVRLTLLSYLLTEQFKYLTDGALVEGLIIEVPAALFAALFIPIIDMLVLDDPIDTKTFNPVKYWVLALFGDYEKITYELLDKERKANNKLQLVENAYLTKLEKARRAFPGREFANPLATIVEPKEDNHSAKPSYGVMLRTALVCFIIIYGLPYLNSEHIVDAPYLNNMGLRLVLAAFVAFKIMPIIEVYIFKNLQDIGCSDSYAFWQHTWVGGFDKNINKIAEHLAYALNKTRAYEKEAQRLDALMMTNQ